MEDVNGIWAIISAVMGAGATLLTVWFKGRNDMNALVDQRLRLALEKDDSAFQKLQEILQSERESFEETLRNERMQFQEELDRERKDCDAKIEALREEINVLRRRLNLISEPEEV